MALGSWSCTSRNVCLKEDKKIRHFQCLYLCSGGHMWNVTSWKLWSLHFVLFSLLCVYVVMKLLLIDIVQCIQGDGLGIRTCSLQFFMWRKKAYWTTLISYFYFCLRKQLWRKSIFRASIPLESKKFCEVNFNTIIENLEPFPKVCSPTKGVEFLGIHV